METTKTNDAQINTKTTNEKNNKSKKRNNKVKYQPFKKKIPTWKEIDQEINDISTKYESLDSTKIENFNDLPLSERTKIGLKRARYIKPTEIQRQSICLALNNHDVLGAAKTGSGKTLAFLIPVIECLYRHKWTKLDGLGALIISPTRELAYQTFEVLKKIGFRHDFSAGLVIGGKDLKFESDLITRTNIIICTPGRLLQHMDETYNFNCDNLKILVLDEADRILDLGFSTTLNAIIQNLPPKRQTLLFSATQTKTISDLARLSLKNPTYVSVHENSNTSTPDNLEQNYVVCEAHEKFNFLWSFIKNHTNAKTICFLQSCKQVKFMYEAFSKLGAGCTLLALYGTMNQLRRMNIYDEFCRKQHAVLFATDVASRGLDFPNVNWVIQVDCPIDATTYIHRVGRTARFEQNGQALLILTSYEKEHMLNELNAKKIKINEINVNKNYLVNIELKLQSFCAQNIELKEQAKRALVAYLKSLFLINNKKLFDIEKIDLVKLSASFGLSIVPRVRFMRKCEAKKLNASNEKVKKVTEIFDSVKDEPIKVSLNKDTGDDDDGDDLFTLKRTHDSQSDTDDNDDDDDAKNIKKLKTMTKAAVARRLKKKNIIPNKLVKYDDDGEPVVNGVNESQSSQEDDDDNDEKSGINIEKAKELLKKQDKKDKELYRQRIKQLHTERRHREKEKRRQERGIVDDNDNEQQNGVELATNSDNDDESNEDDKSSDSDED